MEFVSQRVLYISIFDKNFKSKQILITLSVPKNGVRNPVKIRIRSYFNTKDINSCIVKDNLEHKFIFVSRDLFPWLSCTIQIPLFIVIWANLRFICIAYRRNFMTQWYSLMFWTRGFFVSFVIIKDRLKMNGLSEEQIIALE